MAFALGFFTGIFFLFGVSIIYTRANRKQREIDARFQLQKDELLLKALPVYSQVTRIFKKEEIEPQRIASLMFIAKLMEDNLEQELAKDTPTPKIQ